MEKTYLVGRARNLSGSTTYTKTITIDKKSTFSDPDFDPAKILAIQASIDIEDNNNAVYHAEGTALTMDGYATLALPMYAKDTGNLNELSCIYYYDKNGLDYVHKVEVGNLSSKGVNNYDATLDSTVKLTFLYIK